MLAAAPATASPAAVVAIPATRLDAAILMLAQQSGADIITTETGLHAVQAGPLNGRMPVGKALERLLAGSGYRAIAIDAHSFRITMMPRQAAVAQAPPPAESIDSEIFVTASKQQVPLLRFPGSILYVAHDGARTPAAQVPAMDQIARELSVLQKTDLGEGRNKIFIRGVADSSFSGATQSTASIYFGEVQIGYSGAGPGLALHDVKSIEIMEGPQGTLYGAGAIGGIIRITPNPVDLERASGAMAAGITATLHGAPGFDVNGVINLPLASDRLGLRVVAYHQRDGGYIDDARRGLRNINNVDTSGGRVALRAESGNGWHLDLGVLMQRIYGQDSQYADTRVGPSARRSTLAQPWRNDINAGRIVISRDWDNGLRLVSATGLASSRSQDNFDASATAPASGPILYVDQRNNLLITQETRLTRSLPRGGSWLIGSVLLYDLDEQTRSLGPPQNAQDIVGVTNSTKSASLFSEATLPLGANLRVTTGARLTFARTDGIPSVERAGANFVRGRASTRIDPTIALSWQLAPRLAAFGRFQTGFRTGGLAVARGIGKVADFRPDSILMGEAGLRRERRGETGLSFSAALSYTRWSDIQADLVDRRGQPFTANIGNANIYAIESSLEWVPIRGLTAHAVVLYTYNRVYGAIAQSSLSADQRLPETPALAGNVDLAYRWTVADRSALHVEASAQYVGRSVLGIGNFLDISQGRYAVVRAGAGWTWHNIDTSLTIDNLTNQAGNRFAFGNPFAIATRTQTTPLQPMSVRLGVGVIW
jgi:iron complex outermembrane receptor protein